MVVANPSQAPRAVVVGGSLTGLCAALALARQGWRVTLLERSRSDGQGMGISIDSTLLASITGVDTSHLATMDVGWISTGWGLLHQLLADEVARQPAISLSRGVRVTEVREHSPVGGMLVHSADDVLAADLVVGADGAASTVRRFVSPKHPHATFSGVLLWRGLVREQDTSGGFQDADLRFAFRSTITGALATYGVPGANGEVRSGKRRGAFIFFDPHARNLLHQLGKLDGDTVVGTIQAGELNQEMAERLAQRAIAWPSAWADSAAEVFRNGGVLGTPLTEYRPDRLSRGSAVIIGDAAHAVGPTTGAGFHNGMLDVEALAAALAGVAPTDVPEALLRYEKRRLRPAQQLVARSQQWNRRFVSGAGR